MSRLPACFALIGLSLSAQNVNGPDLEKQAAELKGLVEKARKRPLLDQDIRQ
jgi:hypothetical protein